MKVRVDVDRCQGHAVCAVAAPDVFELGQHGKADVLVDELAVADVDGARAAEASCPDLAITLENAGEGPRP